MNSKPQAMAERLFVRRSIPAIDERVILRHVAIKVERAFFKLGRMPSPGAQAAARCGGIVCFENGKRYVETGLVGIDVPKFGEERLAARLAGMWVN